MSQSQPRPEYRSSPGGTRWPLATRLIFLAGFFALSNSLSSAAEKSEALETQLQRLVEINSGTAHVDGVSRIQNWVSTRLKALGFSVEYRADQLLIATLQGSTPKIVTLIVHADTVFEPSGPFQNYTRREDGKRAIGPGVIDAKGGIVVALEGLKRYLSHGQPKVTLRLISSPSEETGSPGLAEAFRKMAEDSWMVLGFEPALEDGSLIESRRGNRWYEITTRGKEAHAGRAHKDGINACLALASKLTKISKLTRYEKDVTVSIGRMEGGKDKFNIVCSEARAKVDARFSTFPDRDLLHQRIEAILSQEEVAGSKTSFELKDDCPPFSPSERARPYLKTYISFIQNLEDRKIASKISGGSADSNYFSKKGSITIDGLGPVGGKMHTNEEYIELSSLETRSEALHRFLSSLKD